jgi:hypothetical protein
VDSSGAPIHPVTHFSKDITFVSQNEEYYIMDLILQYKSRYLKIAWVTYDPLYGMDSM